MANFVSEFLLTSPSLCMFFLGKNSFRNISPILRTSFNIKVSHTTVSNWCVRFAPLFYDMRLKFLPLLDFSSDEWHADETVVKVAGVKHYLWLVVNSETRFVLDFHLSPYRDFCQAASVLAGAAGHGRPGAIVSDRYSAYTVPVKAFFSGTTHI